MEETSLGEEVVLRIFTVLHLKLGNYIHLNLNYIHLYSLMRYLMTDLTTLSYPPPIPLSTFSLYLKSIVSILRPQNDRGRVREQKGTRGRKGEGGLEYIRDRDGDAERR